MLCGAIPLIGCETISGIDPIILCHHLITKYLGDDGGSCDGDGAGIPFYDGHLRDVQTGDPDRIVQQKIRPGPSQIGDGPAHGLVGGI